MTAMLVFLGYGGDWMGRENDGFDVVLEYC